MAKMPDVVMQKFQDLKNPKFMATVDAEGNPNVVPVLSVTAIDNQYLIFADIMINKTKKNLLDNGKVAVAVITDKGEAYQVKGKFLGFQTSGMLFDAVASAPELKYNAYFGPNGVGVIEVTEVYTATLPLPGERIA
ncbi:MAG: pyridoxamine 5'-phosphate oxidase family protein [Clostridia bacterium]|nr:pyridoxamine 5'-phosphate oxidase family protein [Clostridia bacterium]